MIGILGFNDLHLMQFLYKYTNVLDDKGIEYEVVYWDRSERNEVVGFMGNPVAFEYPMNTYLPFWKKIKGFLKYSHFMRKQIKSKKYTQLIVLTTQTAIPLYDLLIKKYSGRYIYDYRDITKEKKCSFYKRIVQKIIKHSYRTAISSKGFLPEIGVDETDNIVMAHNTQYACEKSEYCASIRKQEPIRIVYWGMVRQLEFNKRVCNAFGNDMRFELLYHGDGYYKELRDYCNAKGYTNISFTGRYSTSTIPGFVRKTDILNCLYENDEIQKCAMPVKAYDAIHYRLPVLITKGSYLNSFFDSIRCAWPIDIDNDDDIGERVYSWYRELSICEIDSGYQETEAMIYRDDVEFEHMVEGFVNC